MKAEGTVRYCKAVRTQIHTISFISTLPIGSLPAHLKALQFISAKLVSSELLRLNDYSTFGKLCTHLTQYLQFKLQK